VNNLVVAVAQGGTWVTVPAVAAPGGGSVDADITHFSAYGLIDPIFAGTFSGMDDIDVGGGTIDPLPTKLHASDPSTAAQFGYSVAISGDLAVVGMPGEFMDEGTAYVFERRGGVWVREETLTPSIPNTGMWGQAFGHAVAISGETIVVGAPGREYDVMHVGRAYVYVRKRVRLLRRPAGFLRHRRRAQPRGVLH
jgi:hypothetical protein